MQLSTFQVADGGLALILVGACLRELAIQFSRGQKLMAKNRSPYDLGAAYAAKLSANGGDFAFTVGGVDFVMPSAAKFAEDELRDFIKADAFANLENALGAEQYAKLQDAAKKANPDGLTWGMANMLVGQFLQTSGLGSQGE